MTWILIIVMCHGGCGPHDMRTETRFWPFQTEAQCQFMAAVAQSRLASRGQSPNSVTCEMDSEDT